MEREEWRKKALDRMTPDPNFPRWTGFDGAIPTNNEPVPPLTLAHKLYADLSDEERIMYDKDKFIVIATNIFERTKATSILPTSKIIICRGYYTIFQRLSHHL
jgi:hypothetical protein